MITVYDDKKQNPQSWEATLSGLDESGLSAHPLFGEFFGFGATEEEAIADLKEAVQEFVRQLQAIDFAWVMVAETRPQ